MTDFMILKMQCWSSSLSRKKHHLRVRAAICSNGHPQSVGHRFYVIARQCFVEVNKGQIAGDAKAIRVPFRATDRIPPQAFCFHTEVRHVQVAAGVRHGVFRKCYLLRAVMAPGCRHFGIKVFEACCSLTQLGAAPHPGNQLAPQAQFRPRAFEKCTALRHLDMEQTEYNPANPNRFLPAFQLGWAGSLCTLPAFADR